MPKEAKFFLSEDDTDLRADTKSALEVAGHKIAFEAPNLETALRGVKLARALDVNVAVLDGNLTPKDHSCSDGRRIAGELRAEIPGIRIVAYSGSEDADYGDVAVDKNNWRSVEILTGAVTSL